MAILFLINISYVQLLCFVFAFFLCTSNHTNIYLPCLKVSDFTFLPDMKSLLISVPMHGLRTPGKEMVFTARPKRILSATSAQIFRFL